MKVTFWHGGLRKDKWECQTNAGFYRPPGIAAGYVGFFQFLRNFHQLTAFEQAEMILYAALDPTVASRAKKGEFVTCLDHFELLQSPIN